MKQVWNYKLKHKLPTKKEERDFVKNLSIREKQYSYKPLKSHEELYGVIKPKIVKYNIFVYLWRKLKDKKWYE